ncbi:transcriptional coactivator p15/PC4 family protein [Labrys monachus]|uniref:Transcriptional coactivator p15 (PC4) C-terminal domain-containing protein n=1 Tax=Labrys monachus TaxID=217067 RepID=A0ABU0FKR9_9HYPH|nr:transcriptional coactivator p15/PC4 family protein [Labrys monachus]MDQ0395194.1 hypothetical protein [Labrys monachus]
MDSPDRVVARVQKNSRDFICIMMRHFKGADFIDLRLFTENGDHEQIATKTGITIKPELLGKVIEGLRQAEALAVAEGLINA